MLKHYNGLTQSNEIRSFFSALIKQDDLNNEKIELVFEENRIKQKFTEGKKLWKT